jgi:hypothetical protein
MRVRMLQATTAYWNYEVRAFGEGDVLDGELALYLLTVDAPVVPDDDDARTELERLSIVRSEMAEEAGREEPSEAPAELDIDAKADNVLVWVGEDPARAAEALAAEQAKDKPRSTLVKQLAKLADSDSE